MSYRRHHNSRDVAGPSSCRVNAMEQLTQLIIPSISDSSKLTACFIIYISPSEITHSCSQRVHVRVR